MIERSIDGFALQDTGIGRHAMSEPNITTDNGIVADSDSSENSGVGIYRDMVSDNRVSWDVDRPSTLVVDEVFCAERHALIEGDMMPDDTSLPYHYARAMVDGEILTNLRTGVDIDTC